MQKNEVYRYNNEMSCLDGVKYKVTRLGAKKATLEPLHGQRELIGLPTFRQPFNIGIEDFKAGIEASIYSLINQ